MNQVLSPIESQIVSQIARQFEKEKEQGFMTKEKESVVRAHVPNQLRLHADRRGKNECAVCSCAESATATCLPKVKNECAVCLCAES